MRLSLAALRGGVVLGSLAVAALVAMAVTEPEPPPAPAAPRARLVGGFPMKGVPLSPDQEARVREIQRRFTAEQRALSLASPGGIVADSTSRAQRFANIDRMLDEQRTLLTAEQRVRYDQNVAEIHASREKVFGR